VCVGVRVCVYIHTHTHTHTLDSCQVPSEQMPFFVGISGRRDLRIYRGYQSLPSRMNPDTAAGQIELMTEICTRLMICWRFRSRRLAGSKVEGSTSGGMDCQASWVVGAVPHASDMNCVWIVRESVDVWTRKLVGVFVQKKEIQACVCIGTILTPHHKHI